MLGVAERGLQALEQELSDLLESVCLLDSDLNPRRDTIDPDFEGNAVELEAAIAAARAAIAKARGDA